MKNCSFSIVLIIGVTLISCVDAENNGDEDPAIGAFEGKEIDLSKDWGEAQHCIVTENSKAECFRTESEAIAREITIESTLKAQLATNNDMASGVLQCISNLTLYDFKFFKGRSLRFWDRGHWQNLSKYHFNNKTSSYRTGACGTRFADGPNGKGKKFCSTNFLNVDELRDWNNRINSIFLEIVTATTGC